MSLTKDQANPPNVVLSTLFVWLKPPITFPQWWTTTIRLDKTKLHRLLFVSPLPHTVNESLKFNQLKQAPSRGPLKAPSADPQTYTFSVL